LFHRILTLLPCFLIAGSLFGAPVAYSLVREKHLRNFRVVEEGVLYRSAQPSPAGLERIIHDYRIRTVVSFRDVEPGKTEEIPDAWEEALCAKLGVKFVRMPLRHWSAKNGPVPAEENVEKLLAILDDPGNHPVLVHCFKGVHRTGTYCAIYRMECQGWSNKDAMEELKALGYDKLDQEDDVRTYLEKYEQRKPRK
jgi:protein tyrosine/serine phosphatase